MNTGDINDEIPPPQPGEGTPKQVTVDSEGNPLEPQTPESETRKRSRGPVQDPSDTDEGNDSISPPGDTDKLRPTER